MKIYQASIKTPFAHLGLSFINDQLAAIDFIDSDKEIKPSNESAVNVCHQIRDYVDKPVANHRFDVTCLMQGTSFQQKVWRELVKIPLGKVVTYGELAKRLDTSARAVGNACRKNPVPLIIPCHRVVSSSGIGGYAGDTEGDVLQIKSWLLRHEGVAVH